MIRPVGHRGSKKNSGWVEYGRMMERVTKGAAGSLGWTADLTLRALRDSNMAEWCWVVNGALNGKSSTWLGGFLTLPICCDSMLGNQPLNQAKETNDQIVLLLHQVKEHICKHPHRCNIKWHWIPWHEIAVHVLLCVCVCVRRTLVPTY